MVVQEPALQVWPAAHAWLQVPQFEGSMAVFTQLPLQSVWPMGQLDVHTLLTQACPLAHAVPQAPPFWWSRDVTTHNVPQTVSPVGQLLPHLPAEQACPAEQA